ncbi:putative 3-sulfolactaldehyde reductase [Hyphomicrobiales bacterium]|nr:putative 3-sulfolactaldehyde reductase [Hyphomicrobiales bacterium]CAH1691278.1 putative 3-sulfolactaldehyde reductase [Hyphomicrobiales bacterium]
MSGTKDIGFIGLGLMGHGMAKNLIEKGHRLFILGRNNRKPIESLVARGATEVSSPAELARRTEIVFTCVSTSADVEEKVYGPEGLLENARPGFVHIDCTTADPTSTLKIAADYQARGMVLVDAALARSPEHAEAGTLNLIVGAEADLLDRLRPVLDCVAENIFHVGRTGAGHRTKLINNFIAMGSASLIADAISAARATGVDLKALYDLISAGGVNSPMFQIMALSALDGDTSRLKFSIANARKDIRYFSDMVNEAEAISLFGPAVLQALTQAVLAGGKDEFVPHLGVVLTRMNDKTV